MRPFLLWLSLSLGLLSGSSAPPASPEPENVIPAAREHIIRATEAYQAGDYGPMATSLEAASTLRPHHGVLTYNLAAAYALNGNYAAALDQLRRVAAMGLHLDPSDDEDFAGLRDDPAFQAIVREIARHAQPVGESREVFSLNRTRFVPESVAYDPKSGTYFVGSVHQREIVAVQNGRAETLFTRDDGLWCVFGMKFDSRTGLLWVCTTAATNGVDVAQEDLGRAAVLAFDPATGRLVHRVEAPAEAGEFWFGDLCLSNGGDVFVSDSKRGEIYRLRRGGDELELFRTCAAFVSLQGIALSGDQRHLYVADYTRGVFRVALDSGEVILLDYPREATLLGIDGLYLHGNALIAIQNGTRPHRVVRAPLTRNGRAVERVEVLLANDPRWDEPTLGVVTGDRLVYVANSQWYAFDREGRLAADTEFRDPLVLAAELPAP